MQPIIRAKKKYCFLKNKQNLKQYTFVLISGHTLEPEHLVLIPRPVSLIQAHPKLSVPSPSTTSSIQLPRPLCRAAPLSFLSLLPALPALSSFPVLALSSFLSQYCQLYPASQYQLYPASCPSTASSIQLPRPLCRAAPLSFLSLLPAPPALSSSLVRCAEQPLSHCNLDPNSLAYQLYPASSSTVQSSPSLTIILTPSPWPTSSIQLPRPLCRAAPLSL